MLDAQLQFSANQAVTGAAVGTNVMDLGGDIPIGTGEPMAVLFLCKVAADQGTGDETYQFDVEYASDAAQTTGRKLLGRRIFQAGTPTAPNVDADLLVAGFQFSIAIPKTGTAESERFLGIRYTFTGTTPSATFSAYLVPQRFVDALATHPKGYTIS